MSEHIITRDLIILLCVYMFTCMICGENACYSAHIEVRDQLYAVTYRFKWV